MATELNAYLASSARFKSIERTQKCMDNAALREDMVDGLEYSLGRPLEERTLDAMRSVPRHEFVSVSPYRIARERKRGVESFHQRQSRGFCRLCSQIPATTHS